MGSGTRCPGNIRKKLYIGYPHPYKSELGDGSRAIEKSLEMIGSTPQGHVCLDLLRQPSTENTGMLAAVANCGRSWKWCGGIGRLVLGFKPRHSSHAASFGDHVSFWDHVSWAEKKHRPLFLFLR